MNLSSIIILALVVYCVCGLNLRESQCLNLTGHLGSARKRRHLTFPDKSNIVLTISLVKAFMTHAPSGWNIALEFDVSYTLPDKKFTNRAFRGKLHHQQKRELWERLERTLDFYNINGRACILRSICEAKNNLAPKGKSLVHDILRAIFTAPLHEEEFKEEIKDYIEFSNPFFCEEINDCPLSIIDFLLALNIQ